MAATSRFIGWRILVLVVAAALVVLAIDTGSVTLTKTTSADDVREAGYSAAAVAKRGPATRATAMAALYAAEQDAGGHGITVSRRSFEIYPDGSVTLTGTKTASTLLIHHLAPLAHWARVSTTLTVEPLPYD